MGSAQGAQAGAAFPLGGFIPPQARRAGRRSKPMLASGPGGGHALLLRLVAALEIFKKSEVVESSAG